MLRFVVEITPDRDGFGVESRKLTKIIGDGVEVDAMALIISFLRDYVNTLPLGVWCVSCNFTNSGDLVFAAQPWDEDLTHTLQSALRTIDGLKNHIGLTPLTQEEYDMMMNDARTSLELLMKSLTDRGNDVWL